MTRTGRSGRLGRVAALVLAQILLLVIGGMPGAVHAGAAPLEGSRPDIVLVIVDDMAADAMPRVLRRMTSLRAMFLEQGIRFPNAFGQDPQCCPGRAGILTGLTSTNHGVQSNDARLLDPSVTIATALQAAGYHTQIVGKYLNQTDLLTDRTPPGWDRVAISGGGYSDWVLWSQGRREFHGDSRASYSTDVFARRSAAWLRDAPADRPRLVVLAPYATHGDPDHGSRLPTPAARHRGDAACAGIGFRRTPAFDEPRAERADRSRWVRSLGDLSRFPEYDARGWPLRPACEAMLSVDAWFRRVVDIQRSQGRLERTLFILVGDNGMSWGDHAHFAKSVSWTTPIPLWVAWPGVLEPGSNPAFVQNIDLAPTITALAGTTLGPYPGGRQRPDGRSLLATLEAGGPTGLRRMALLEEHHDPEWPKLDWDALRTTGRHPCGRWHYTRWSNGDVELFDLAADPWELTNLASARSGIVAQLDAELARAHAGRSPRPTTCAEEPARNG